MESYEKGWRVIGTDLDETVRRRGDEIVLPTDIVADVDAGRAASPPLRRLLVVSDVTVLVLGWVAAGFGVLWAGGGSGVGELALQGAVVVPVGGLLLSASGLYRRSICAVRTEELARIVRSVAALGVLAALLLAPHGVQAAGVAALAGVVTWGVLLAGERGVFREWIQLRRAGGDFGAPVVVVGGTDESIRRTAAFLDDNPYLGFDVRAVLGPAVLEGDRFRWLGDVDAIVRQVQDSGATGVVLDAGSLTGDQLNDAVRELSAANLHVHVSSGLRGVDQRRITVSPLADETFLHVAPLTLSRRQGMVKRLIDVVLATLVLVVTAPVWLLAAAAIWLTDRGPVLYRQQRIGIDGEPFTLYKLRSMVVGADQRLVDLAERNGRDGPLFKLSDDPRVTRVGRFLRAASIDELPQLLNVLEGTMSIVGPRPALPDEAARFDRTLAARLSVKPGVTGLWQVEARDLPSFDLYRRYDLLYVQNWSLLLDLSIIVRTTSVVLLRGLRSLVPAGLRRADAGLVE